MKLGGAAQKDVRVAESSPRQEVLGHALVGVSSLFRQVLDIVTAVAVNDCIVLLEGESGTGKELLARLIHAKSPRANGPFIPVNCPGISESLFESQFYGHLKGSFTGAASDTLGVVRAAEGGSLLLDEVGELPLHLQPKLLRLLQEREVTPVGASRPIPVDTRFVAATNRSLAKAVAEGHFRSDLYHRLNIVRVEIPPLRTRPEDIEPLLDYYNAYYAAHYGLRPREFSQRLRQVLKEYTWPGNVRELCAYIERIYAANLPPAPPTHNMWDDGYGIFLHKAPAASSAASAQEAPQAAAGPSCRTLAEAEDQAIRRAMQAANQNRSEAARILNIHRSTLLRKMRQYGME